MPIRYNARTNITDMPEFLLFFFWLKIFIDMQPNSQEFLKCFFFH